MSGILDSFEVYIEILFTYVFVTHIAVAYGKNLYFNFRQIYIFYKFSFLSISCFNFGSKPG